MKLLIDSDILVEVSRGRNSQVIGDWRALALSEAIPMCSAVTVAELWHGALPREAGVLEDLFSAFVCLPIDEATGRAAGLYLRQFHRSHGVELGDALIAATASVHKVPLWTRNRKHYPMRDIRFWDRAVLEI